METLTYETEEELRRAAALLDDMDVPYQVNLDTFEILADELDEEQLQRLQRPESDIPWITE